jgi:hypothetical protein
MYAGESEEAGKLCSEIQERYKNSDLPIQILRIDGQPTKQDLLSRLRSVDAVYVLLTRGTKVDELQKTLNEWAVANPGKPVLLADVADFDIPFAPAFNTVRRERSLSAISHLLWRSVERAALWNAQAVRLWKALLLTTMLSFLLFALAIAALHLRLAASETLVLRDSTAENDIRSLNERFDLLRPDLAKAVFGSFAYPGAPGSSAVGGSATPAPDTASTQASQSIRKLLDAIADYAGKDMVARSASGSRETSPLTLWRKQEVPKTSGRFLVRITPSEGPSKDFPDDDSSVVGCAIRHNGFVLWKDNVGQGEAAAWDVGGKRLATWNKARHVFGFDSGGLCSYSPDKTGHQRRGILCFGESPDDRNGFAACLDTNMDPGFLESDWVKHYLRRTLSIMHLVPDEVFRTTNY